MSRKNNLTSKTLRQFAEGDTIYISRMKGGMQYVYFCRFLRLNKGIVVAEIIAPERNHDHTEGELRARPKSCYLWGKSKTDKHDWERCHWFKSLDTEAE